MTIYYVSASSGDDGNAGTSTDAPLATLQAAANVVQPGDTVQVMSGTYTGPAYGDVVDVTTSGTQSAPITFEAAPGQTPIIDSSGAWQAVNIKASYIIFNGFTVVGDAADFTLSQALAQYSTGNAELDGNGITVNSPDGVFVPNHITIENNTVYNEPGAGISSLGADYVQILNNVVHNNANWSAFGASGIGIGISANSDTNSGTHFLISGNISYDNQELVPEYRAGAITDGEGIILDTNPGFVGNFLVQGNTAYGNSGPGIESFLTDNATITANTSYGNLTNATLATEGQIFINQSNNNIVSNNVTIAALCFLAGTKISIPGGEARVESLTVGALVNTVDGRAKRIVWIGVGRVLAVRGLRNAATPVIVRKGALADNVPHCDLRVTKGHAFYIDNVLIPVEFLVNHQSIIFDDHAQEVKVYHIELETHDVLLANGAPAESYRDDGNRWLFQNGNTAWDLPGKTPYAPILTGGPVVDRVWRRLLERAGPPRVNLSLTDDADLHLLVDGKRVDAIERSETSHAFRLRSRPRSARFRSRATAPQEVGIARDERTLGVAVRRIVLAQARLARAIEAEAALLADGYHMFESEKGIRWTDGDAAVPAELFTNMHGPGMLILQLGGATTLYLDY